MERNVPKLGFAGASFCSLIECVCVLLKNCSERVVGGKSFSGRAAEQSGEAAFDMCKLLLLREESRNLLCDSGCTCFEDHSGRGFRLGGDVQSERRREDFCEEKQIERRFLFF